MRKKELGANKKCKHCQSEIDPKAKVCPTCKKSQGMSGCLKAIIILIILIIGIILMMGACTKEVVDSIDESIEETENSYKDKNGKTSFKKGETFENSYIKMTMTEVNLNFKDYNKYTSVKDGYKLVMVKFNVENIGDEDKYVSYLDFNCYADDVAMEENYLVFDRYEHLSATISSGKKTAGYVFYEVPKNAESIVFEYEPSWFQDVKVEFVAK
ncbi:MAG: DUF4352 domain-containing protein [Firmicutes bacterium]|nr:DUF4352 domain-containing protein [Bacillota bacterium]